MTQPAASTGSHRSIATRLLRVSFEYYVVIAIILTALVVWGEYLSTTSALRREIANYQHVFEAPLANALWAMDTSKVSSISKGMAIRMRGADQRIGSSVLGALDFLDEIWGQWNYNKEYDQVQFSPPGALRKYTEFMETIEAASREQNELQEQLKAEGNASP